MIKSDSEELFDKEKYKNLLKKSLFENVNSKFEEILLKCKLVKNYTLLNLINPYVALLNTSKSLFQSKKNPTIFESKYFIRNVCVSKNKGMRSFTPSYQNSVNNNDLSTIIPNNKKDISEEKERKITKKRNNSGYNGVGKGKKIKMCFYNTGKFDMPLALQFQEQKEERKDKI